MIIIKKGDLVRTLKIVTCVRYNANGACTFQKRTKLRVARIISRDLIIVTRPSGPREYAIHMKDIEVINRG